MLKIKQTYLEAITKAINGKNASFMTEVNAIMDLLLNNALKSIDKPKAIIIKGIAP